MTSTSTITVQEPTQYEASTSGTKSSKAMAADAEQLFQSSSSSEEEKNRNPDKMYTFKPSGSRGSLGANKFMERVNANEDLDDPKQILCNFTVAYTHASITSNLSFLLHAFVYIPVVNIVFFHGLAC